MRAITFLAALALLGCSQSADDTQTAEAAANAAAAAAEPQSIFKVDANVLSCSPAMLHNGEPLVLTLGAGHGSELGVVREEGEVPYFMVIQGPPDDMKTLMARGEFGAATRVEVPSDATGFRWVGEGGNERIFTTPGTYEVLISNSLESEDGGHMCVVQYLG